MGSFGSLSSVLEDGLFPQSSVLQFHFELLLFLATSLLALELDCVVSLQDAIVLSDELCGLFRLPASLRLILLHDLGEPFLILQFLLLADFLSQLDFLRVLLAFLDLHGESFGHQLGSDGLLSLCNLLELLRLGLTSLSSSEDSFLKVNGLLEESILLSFL